MSMFLNLCQRFISPGFISNSALALTTPGNCTLISIRNKVRCYFPKPKEVKRIKMHGWKKRMSTTEGRRVLMRRILKGRHALSH